MSDIFDDRKKALEEEYFRKREQELIEKLKQRARAETEREGLAEAAGVTNEQILEAFREMGFDRETVALLHFIPLLEVAWSDGSVSAKERAGILEMARARGIMEGSPAHGKLARVAREPARLRALRAGENSDARPPSVHDRGQAPGGVAGPRCCL